MLLDMHRIAFVYRMVRSKLYWSKATIEKLYNYCKEVCTNLAFVSIAVGAALC